MTNLVPTDQIEGRVGARRRELHHLGRAVSTEEAVYILHSKRCLESGVDLRKCPFSLALDKGIDLALWAGWQDKPVVLRIARTRLAPARAIRS